jgi:hypothetical protein
MRSRARSLAVVVLATLCLALGCSRSPRAPVASQGPLLVAPAPGILFRSSTDTTPTEELTQLAGPQLATVTGIASSFDPSTKVLQLQDGRVVALTGTSRIAGTRPGGAVSPGDRVVARDVLPVAAPGSPVPAGRPRMATVAAVDPQRAIVWLTDGTVVRIGPATAIHMGGQPLLVTDLRPGDELVILRAGETLTDGGAAPSALPRPTSTSRGAGPAAALLVFRETSQP